MSAQHLFNESDGYGERYQGDLLEQYKLYLESIERISDRRQKVHDHFLATNTLFITFIGVVSKETGIITSNMWLGGLSLIGVGLCGIWYFLNNSYRQLNTGKFELLHEIETHLPLNLFSYEWRILGEGKDKKRYYPFSHVEAYIPAIFGTIYILLTFWFLFGATPVNRPERVDNTPTEHKENIIPNDHQISPVFR